MDIVMIFRDRPELTAQTLRSMCENAHGWKSHRLVAVWDGDASEECDPNGPWGEVATALRHAGAAVISTGKQLGVGGAKNYGAKWHQETGQSRPGELIVFVDNDMYLLPDWDRQLTVTMSDPVYVDSDHRDVSIVQLGGWRHPFHVPKRSWGQHAVSKMLKRPPTDDLHEVDAVTGNLFAMRWADWLKYGPFDANAVGPGQSEDFALSQRVRAGGGLVATLDPPVAIHCGLVNSEGEPATGWRECETQITEQLARLSPEMRDSILIMRPGPGPTETPVGYEVRENAPTVAEELADRLNAAAVSMGLLQPNERLRGPFPDPRDVIQGPLASVGLRREVTVDEVREMYPYKMRPIGINVGSGQRRFESTKEVFWKNVDSQSVPPDRIPDLVCDVGKEPLPYKDACAQYVVLHQVLEHFGCGESASMLRECWRVLAPGGSLIVTVPDMRRLAARWLGGELDTQLFMTNVYGAYMGDEADRHRWGFDKQHLFELLGETLFGSKYATYGLLIPDAKIRLFDWRAIPGASLANDWWVLAMEAIKQ